MKAVFVLFFTAIVLHLAAGQTHSHGNGQPSCSDPSEFNRLWRNNWDPNSFFRCDNAGVPATLVRCQAAFIESAQRCGDWSEW
ncbi:hypothetical protein Bhyg_17413, partial [Pseudolycoriella hygida]